MSVANARFYSKAQLDVQFHWVFVLLIGAIILSFFVGVALWYKDTQQQKITADIVVTIDSLFASSKESPKTAQTTALPDLRFAFTCAPESCTDYGCASEFSSSGISRGTETDVLFSLGSVSGDTLITWALEWSMPYKIANFLYVTTDSVRYILVSDDDHSTIASAVNTLLSENSYLTKEMVKIKTASDLELVNKNDAFVRIVAFVEKDTLQESAIEEVLGEKGPLWDIVYIDDDKASEDSGTVFYADGSATYIGLPLLIGALFSQDSSFYSCNLQKAFLQGKLISGVYLERTKKLEKDFGADPERNYCAYYYDTDVQKEIQNIENAFAETTPTLSSLSAAVTTLEANNKYAVLKGCPRVY